MKPETLPNLFEYGDFRRFLQDCYTERKRIDPTYSYKRLADSVGFGSPNYPKLVIDGERALTVSNIHRLAQALRLTPSETAYFETLVHLNQASTALEKSFYQARLSDLKKRVAPAGRPLRVNRTLHPVPGPSGQEFESKKVLPGPAGGIRKSAGNTLRERREVLLQHIHDRRGLIGRSTGEGRKTDRRPYGRNQRGIA